MHGDYREGLPLDGNARVVAGGTGPLDRVGCGLEVFFLVSSQEHPSPALPLAFGQREGVVLLGVSDCRESRLCPLPCAGGGGEGWGGVRPLAVKPQPSTPSHLTQ
ncbi:hypothetical protein D3C81_1764640 [compost metagenome]